MSHISRGKLLVVGGLILLSSVLSKTISVSAESAYQIDPVQISPVCSTAADSTATWSAYNKNASSVTFNWTNKDTEVSGTYTAPANSTTSFKTNYSLGQNNQTEFTNEGSTSPVDRNATNTPCVVLPIVPPVIPCIDGNIKSNLISTWNGSDTFTVHTKNNGLLCDDVTLYVSDYILPANYDGTGFGDSTSYPQNVYQSYAKTLTKGTDGSSTLIIPLPPVCNNTQVDLYYAPEISLVGANGHGNQFINGGILPKSTAPCVIVPPVVTPPVVPPVITPVVPPTGGMGGGEVTTPVATTPVATPVVATPVVTKVVAPSAPTLVNTGVKVNLVSLLAGITLALAAFVATRRTKISE